MREAAFIKRNQAKWQRLEQSIAGSERDAGAPTAYLALDVGVLLAEWARNADHGEGASASLWQVRFGGRIRF